VHGVAQAEIDHRVFEDAPDQELHRQVVDALALRLIGFAGGLEPRLDQDVAHAVADRHAPVIEAGVGLILAQRIGKMLHDAGAQGFA